MAKGTEVRGYGYQTKAQIVGLVDHEKVWDEIAALRDRKGRRLCPVGLVDASANRWLALETDASEYGRPVAWDMRTEQAFRVVRAAKLDAENEMRKAATAARERK